MLLQTPQSADIPQVPPIIAECPGTRTPQCDRREARVWQEYVATAQPGDVFRVPFHPNATVLEAVSHSDGVTYLTTEGTYFVAFDPGDVGNPPNDPPREPELTW